MTHTLILIKKKRHTNQSIIECVSFCTTIIVVEFIIPLFCYYSSYFKNEERREDDVIMSEQVLEYIKYGFWILFGSGIFIEITPIKIKPISKILKWIGKKLNEGVREDISKLETKVNTIQKDLQTHTIESQRRDILIFADELRMGIQKSKESFDNTISLHDRYEKYLKLNNLDNGKVDLAFKYISKRYHECMENNSFYIGR